MIFPAIYLLHGKGGSPNGSVRLLQGALEPLFPASKFIRPLLPHNKWDEVPSKSVKFLARQAIPKHALLIGVSLGGTVAAKLQETKRTDVMVIGVCSPTYSGDVSISKKMGNRVIIFSKKDEVIRGRVKNWPEFAKTYDFPWLTHDIDPHVSRLADLIRKYTDTFST